MIHQNLPFAHNYECRLLPELAGCDGYRLYFAPPSQKTGRDGVAIKVKPACGPPWIGTFAFGWAVKQGFSGVFSMPHPDHLCVVANGCAYAVNAANPKDWSVIPADPVANVYFSRRHNIIVFCAFIDIVAYGSSGCRWRTGRLAWDGFTITRATDDSLEGRYWDMRSDSERLFKVDLSSGQSLGGAFDSSL